MISKEKFFEIYRSRTFGIVVNISRILLVFITLAILYVLVSEIQAVKMLQYDPCRLCENKTGAVCFFYDYADEAGVKIIEKPVAVYPELNLTTFNFSK